MLPAAFRHDYPAHSIIELRHPGLADSRPNLLFRFPAYDHLDGGVHHSVALTAYAIVAGNKWTGYLSETAGGPAAANGLREGVDQVLAGRCYYFYPYPYGAGKPRILLHGSSLTYSFLQQTTYQQPHPPRAAHHCCTLSIRPFRTGDSLTRTFRPGGLSYPKGRAS